MESPQIQYVHSADGASIAFYDMGEGTPLVISPNLWSHLTATWFGESRESTLRLIREGFRIIRYDMRGMGLSDRDVEDFSLEAQASDIEAVRERLGLERFVLYGVVHGTLPSMMYAADHSEHVSRLILNVPFADGEGWYKRTPTLQGLESFRAMGAQQWNLYIQTHATALAGMLSMGDPQEMAKIMLQSASPESLGRYLAALRTYDVRDVLGRIRTPTLAFNTGNGLDSGFSQAAVAGIPGARLVRVRRASSIFAIPSALHVPAITRFVFGRDARPEDTPSAAAPAPHGTAIVLVADIANSTALTERMGDAAFREKARVLDTTLRGAVREHGGSVIDAKTLGDGILATFAGASQAIGAALACAAAGEGQGMPVHVGLHAGDVIREEDNVFGGAVNIAARISALSAAGEVLVSATVRDLGRTSAGVVFEDRGEVELKGIVEPQRVFAVRREGA